MQPSNKRNGILRRKIFLAATKKNFSLKEYQFDYKKVSVEKKNKIT